MMTKDEALKMAYKAEKTGNLQDLVDAVNALMEALEQPITRDWKETIDERIAMDSVFKEALEQPPPKVEPFDVWAGTKPQLAQEPVAWIEVIDHYGHKTSRINLFDKGLELADGTNLYTHPAQTWQGLTDEEIGKLFSEFIASHHTPTDSFKVIAGFAHAIEQTLKEKNHGI